MWLYDKQQGNRVHYDLCSENEKKNFVALENNSMDFRLIFKNYTLYKITYNRITKACVAYT